MDIEQTQARRWQLLARMDEDEFEAEPAALWRGRLRAASRNGIGARVAVKAGGVVQTDEVRSGGSYISHNDMRLHFGLGEATRVESIEVRWPGRGGPRHSAPLRSTARCWLKRARGGTPPAGS